MAPSSMLMKSLLGKFHNSLSSDLWTCKPQVVGYIFFQVQNKGLEIVRSRNNFLMAEGKDKWSQRIDKYSERNDKRSQRTDKCSLRIDTYSQPIDKYSQRTDKFSQRTRTDKIRGL